MKLFLFSVHSVIKLFSVSCPLCNEAVFCFMPSVMKLFLFHALCYEAVFCFMSAL